MNNEPSSKEIDELYKTLENQAEKRKYHLNPDIEFTKELVIGLITNTKRYGYPNCPCRLATGKKKQDLDMICPCDYRDADLNEFGACYCALYVTKDVKFGKQKLKPIPDRRPTKEMRETMIVKTQNNVNKEVQTKLPVWRCRVCGYLCARDSPPDECPICGASKERFEKFM